MPAGADGPWLDRAEQAERLGVTVGTISGYVIRYGPDHAHPYPVHVAGEHKRFGRSTAVTAAALDRWNSSRMRPRGRPRKTPPGLTPAAHAALAGLARGLMIRSGRIVNVLVVSGLAERSRGRVGLTASGREMLVMYPYRQPGGKS